MCRLLLCSLVVLLLAFLFSTAPARALDPGDLLISELMPNPDGLVDSDAEWIELYNPGAPIADLRGLQIVDTSAVVHTIAGPDPIPLAPGEFFLLARSGDPLLNGGLLPDQVYSAFLLNNSGDTVQVLDGATQVAQAAYILTSSGQSLELASLSGPGVGVYQEPEGPIEYAPGNFGTPGVNNLIPLPAPPAVPGVGPIGAALAIALMTLGMFALAVRRQKA